MPDKIDIHKGADILEKIMQGDRIKDNRIVIPDTFLGLIVSGPVQKPRFQNKELIFSNASNVSSNNTEYPVPIFWEIESVPD